MDADLVTHIKVLSWRGADHILYPIEVTLASGQKWIVERRYSEFEDLHKALVCKEVDIAVNFNFPEKKWLGHSAECLDGRQRDFESYLSDLILVSPRLTELYEFLEVGQLHEA